MEQRSEDWYQIHRGRGAEMGLVGSPLNVNNVFTMALGAEHQHLLDVARADERLGMIARMSIEDVRRLADELRLL